MSYSLSPLLKPRFFVNATNKPLVGGKLYTYLAETTTPATTYSNDTGTPNTNPIILDANGECNLYLDDDKVYRLILKDANDVTYFDKDRVSSIGGGDSKVLTFNTIADLRLKIGSEKEPTAQTSGYYAAGDGGGNRFYWDGTSGATDNGGTVIKPTFVSGAGRWLAIDAYTINVRQFGAKGNGSTDGTTAIQAAINAAYGKTLYIPSGQYYLNTVTNSALLSIAGRIKIVADFGAAFVYGSAATNTIDVIRVDPQTIADEGIEIEGLWIYEKTGSPARDVIRIRLDATHGLKKLRLTNCLFRSKNGYAVSCFNSTYLNTNGLFLTDIDKCEFVGGFYSDGHGDTTRIANSAFAGQNRGIEIEMLPDSAGAGASSSLQIVNNNITSYGGAIFIRNGRNVMIEGNNIEQLTDFSGNYCIQLNNVDYDTTGVSWVRGNKIEPNDPASKCSGLGMYRCKKTIVEGNQIGTSAKTAGTTISVAMTECSDIKIFYNNLYISDNCWGVYAGATCTNVSYKPGKVSNFNANYIEVLDEGVGTKGVFKTPTFENSWTNASNTAYQVARFVKRDEGDVLLEGVLASGTLTGDTTMFTLPTGFRPAKRLTFIAPCFTSGGVHGQAVVRIDPDGTVRMRNASTGGIQLLELSLCGINFNALLA